MNRRSFLMKLGAGMIGALVVRPTDEEFLYYNPDKLSYYWGVPGGGKSEVLTESDIVKAELNKFLPKVKDLFEHDDLFYKMIKARHPQYHGGYK